MKMLATLCPLVLLVGCTSMHPLNSEQHISALSSSFSSACQKAGGATGQPTAQGSSALCTTKSGVPVNMYVNSAFVLLQADSPPTSESWSKFLGACGPNGGISPPKLAFRNGQWVSLTNGKEKCEKAGVWIATQEFTKDKNNERSRVFYSFPRDNKGNVIPENWGVIYNFI